MSYKTTIAQLLDEFPIELDLETQIKARAPTMANSMFLTNKEQGDWAEEIVLNAINNCMNGYCALRYGRSESLAAGDPGFKEFYEKYINELNDIGKRPDILIYRQQDIPKGFNLDDDDFVSKALAAIEVRSSSFLAVGYATYMADRLQNAFNVIEDARSQILSSPYRELLHRKNRRIFDLMSSSTSESFQDWDFRCPSWSSTNELRELTALFRKIKDQVKILHKRDYLSITPKLEDIALVNRWIQRFGVRHYYLQTFFDKGYLMSFQDILRLVCDTENEETKYSIERDVKNQGKTTIKINVNVGKEILGRIDMPEHYSALKILERGRLLFYVKFRGGRGYLDSSVFDREIVDG